MNASVALERSSCCNGCAPDDEVLFLARDRLNGLPGEFPLVRCRTCGLLRLDPRPTPAAMGFYYPESYGPYHGTRIRASGPAWRRLLRRLARGVFRFNTEALPPLPPGRLLEIGCASGAFLARMAGQGWRVQGLEPSAQASARAREAGLSVHTGTVEDAPEPAEPFDLVAGWMVLEHLHDPVAALRRLARWTRPGGWLALSLPNAASLEFRLFRRHWYALQAPTHLFHFTPRTLAPVLARGGWRLERVLHQRVLGNLFGSLGLALEERGAPAWLSGPLRRFPEGSWRWNALLLPLAWPLAALGQTGRMTVWARREEG